MQFAKCNDNGKVYFHLLSNSLSLLYLSFSSRMVFCASESAEITAEKKTSEYFPFRYPASSDEVFSLFAGAESETLFYETF